MTCSHRGGPTSEHLDTIKDCQVFRQPSSRDGNGSEEGAVVPSYCSCRKPGGSSWATGGLYKRASPCGSSYTVCNSLGTGGGGLTDGSFLSSLE